MHRALLGTTQLEAVARLIGEVAVEQLRSRCPKLPRKWRVSRLQQKRRIMEGEVRALPVRKERLRTCCAPEREEGYCKLCTTLLSHLMALADDRTSWADHLLAWHCYPSSVHF